MSSFDYGKGSMPSSPDAAPVSLPTRCPSCRSLAISTTARKPAADAYWRCGGCGEVWNASRRESAANARRPAWR